LFKELRARYLDGVGKACGERAFQAALSEGRAMSLTEAVQYALSETSLLASGREPP
jgi:hypothetical protein